MVKKINKFTISKITESGIFQIIIKNNLTEEFVSIIPESGARLKELWLNNGKRNISILKKIESIKSKEREDLFTNAKLSPFAGRIKEGQYTFNDTQYSLELNYPEESNACHGFIYDKKFRYMGKEIHEEYASCTFEYNYENEVKGYPFSYLIEINYQLSSVEGVTCTTRIINKSCSVIPISDGWHHYFDFGIPVNQIKLKLDRLKHIELDSSMIPDGKMEDYDLFREPREIGSRHFDSCFKLQSNGKAVTELISEELNIDLLIWQETGTNKYGYLVIYTPPDRKTIAIEPITSNTNSFNNKEGLILLSPADEFISRFGMYMRRK